MTPATASTDAAGHVLAPVIELTTTRNPSHAD